MSRPATTIPLSLLGFVFLTATHVAAQELPREAVLLIVQQPTDFMRAADDNSTTAQRRLNSHTVVRGLQRGEYGSPSRPAWRVAALEAPSNSGWVPAGAVMPLDAVGQELKAKAVALRSLGTEPAQPSALPALILLQRNPAIRQAWQEVAAAISENETLPDSERLPEPYFARAEIWATAGNYSDSLQDYLYGISIVRVSARDLLSYSVQFDKLGDVADKLQKMPVPAAGAEPIYSSAAREHYSLGYGLFFRDDLRAALEHFDSAVQLAPDQPLYWYFRALTYHGLGDEQRAQHDALMGAFFERELAAWYRRSLHRAFIRIQGARRAWLESYRLGSPTPRLVAQP